eukprot:9750391-Alexandrium_andersonii.AAC.1
MSASLVGSEMCIRDSISPRRLGKALGEQESALRTCLQALQRTRGLAEGASAQAITAKKYTDRWVWVGGHLCSVL